jgi:hypothetical protein
MVVVQPPAEDVAAKAKLLQHRRVAAGAGEQNVVAGGFERASDRHQRMNM